MDAPKVPETTPALSIVPAQFEIVLSEDSGNPLSFVSPPLNDISEMAELRRECFSLARDADKAKIFEDSARQRLSELTSKAEKFQQSATFHNRVANLQKAIGDLHAESTSLARVAELSDRAFFRRKLGENLFSTGKAADASELFRSLATHDAYSALRIASLCIHSHDVDEADHWVQTAVNLEPDNYAARLFQGGILLFRGESSKAIRVLWLALHDRPNSSVVYTNLAWAYLSQGNAKKAFTCLKRAVALDPLNRSAVLALADIGHALERDADVVNSVRYFVQFEQREPAIWGRLARSLLKLGAIDDCIAALKRQGAFERSVSLWNNLGVAYALKKSRQQSLEAFNYALTIEGSGGSREELIVARNAAQLISNIGKPELLYEVTRSVISQDTDRTLSRDPQLCDLYGFYISALVQTSRKEEARSLSMSLVTDPSIGAPLAKWLVQSLAGTLGLNRKSDDELNSILDTFIAGPLSTSRDVGLINNVAFALIELGRVDEAEKCLGAVANALHTNAYLTATFGLLNFRKGRFARGEALYKEAISLAATPFHKTRIRQKMYLEIGRAAADNPVAARRALEKVVRERRGESELTTQASSLLNQLPRALPRKP